MEIYEVVGRSAQIQPTRSSQKSGAHTTWSPLNIYFELKRRGVLQAGTSYIIIAWLMAQVAELIGEIFATPGWILQALVIALAIGLPVALALSWAFELTPGGLKLESELPPAESIARQKGRSLVCGLIAILVLTIGALVVNRDASVCALSQDVSIQEISTPANSQIMLYFSPESTKL